MRKIISEIEGEGWFGYHDLLGDSFVMNSRGTNDNLKGIVNKLVKQFKFKQRNSLLDELLEGVSLNDQLLIEFELYNPDCKREVYYKHTPLGLMIIQYDVIKEEDGTDSELIFLRMPANFPLGAVEEYLKVKE